MRGSRFPAVAEFHVAAIFHVVRSIAQRFAGDCKRKYDLGTCTPFSVGPRQGGREGDLHAGGEETRENRRDALLRGIAEGAPPPLTLMRL